MSTRQIKLYTSEQGTQKKQTTTVSNVNPEATGATMLAFARKLNDFTTNTYNTSDLVETYNLDTETPPEPPAPKQTATLTVSPNTIRYSSENSLEATVTMNSDYTGKPFISLTNQYAVQFFDNANELYIVSKVQQSEHYAETLTVMIPETENYTAATATITITAN